MDHPTDPNSSLDQDRVQPVNIPQSLPDTFLTTALTVTFGIFLFASTFSIAVSQIALGLSLALYLTVAFKTDRPTLAKTLKPILILIMTYVSWLALSALAGTTPTASLWALREEWLFMAIPIAYLLFRNQSTSERLLLALAAGLCLVATYGIVQHFTAVHWFRDNPVAIVEGLVRPSGNFSHPLTYGNYVVVATLFVLGYYYKRFNHLAALPRTILALSSMTGLIAISLLNSRGPMLAAALGLLALALLARKLRYLLPVLAIGLILSFWLSPGLADIFTKRFEHDLETSNPLSRLYIWENSAKIIGENPVFGVGAGNFEAAYLEQVVVIPERPYAMGHAHSDFINIAAVNGLPGLLLYLAIWTMILRQFFMASQLRERAGPGSALAFAALAASIGFLITSLTEATFADEEVRQLLMAIWGAGLAGTGSDSN